MKVLVVNAGSSSLKYQLLDMENESLLAKGVCERIGIDGKFTYKLPDGRKLVKEIAMPNHAVAFQTVVDALTDKELGCIRDMKEIGAVGHRFVHGGPYFTESCLYTEKVAAQVKELIDLAPLHIPASITGLEGCSAVLPGVPQVLVFDTAFHNTMPAKAYTYPIACADAEKYHIRRYGFHGTSHRFVSEEMAKLLNKPVEETKIVTCHIGNGSSVTAVMGGKSVDTSMGFTPLDGIIMGTRCGSIDPAIVPYLMKKKDLDPDGMSDYMNKACGFLGVSGFSSDSRDIEEGVLKGDERAILTADIQAYQIQKLIGAYAAAMNGLDAVVFTAGMGENCPELRERVCTNMEFLGIEIDRALNAKTTHQNDYVKLSTDASRVLVYVIPTDEELMIARDTAAIAAQNR